MDKNQSVFDAAHKGDFDFIKTKLDENPNLLHQRDLVCLIKLLQYVDIKTNIFRIKECLFIGQYLVVI